MNRMNKLGCAFLIFEKDFEKMEFNLRGGALNFGNAWFLAR